MWYYPVMHYDQRPSYKSFGQLMTAEFYVGKEKIFPTKYFGYHAAKDLETLPGEENAAVEVYAIGDGKILFLGSVTGYGGVILESLDNTNNTALYGHVKIASAEVKQGEQVKAGQKMVALGDAFSSETGGERKHLHFGIYKGQDIYYRGYEPTLAQLKSRWEDPDNFLRPNPPWWQTVIDRLQVWLKSLRALNQGGKNSG